MPFGSKLRCVRPPPASMTIALLVMVVGSVAHAETHQICVDFELGPQLWDASPRPDSEIPCSTNADCNNADPNLTPWEICSVGVCIWAFSSDQDYGEDKGRWEGERPFPASRRLVRVLDDATDEVVWGWGPLDELGCTGVFDDDALKNPLTDVRIQRIRWSLTPEGTSIIGYECELSDGGMAPAGSDGQCETLTPSLDEITASIGGGSVSCGGGGESVDHCTDYEIGEGLFLEPIDYSLWSVTFADTQVNPQGAAFQPTEIYLLQETDTGNNTGTSAGPWMGGHPTVRFKFNEFHSKFTAAHEYGHLAFFSIPNEQDSPPHPFDPINDLDYTAQSLPSHLLNSPEWDAAAAVEGFANLAALMAWYDLDDSPIRYVRLDEAGDGGQARTMRDFASMANCIPGCMTGQSNELNWGGALREFLIGIPAPSLSLVAGMLSAVHGSMWYPSGLNDDFADEFDDVMDPNGQDYLGDEDLYLRWTDLVADWEIGA
jgi:hypothetical protein